MQGRNPKQPPRSPVPGIMPEPVGIHEGGPAAMPFDGASAAPGGTTPDGAAGSGQGVRARVVRYLRGDRYMVEADSPAWRSGEAAAPVGAAKAEVR